MKLIQLFHLEYKKQLFETMLPFVISPITQVCLYTDTVPVVPPGYNHSVI